MKQVVKRIIPAQQQQVLGDARASLQMLLRFLRFRHATGRTLARRRIRASWRRPDPPTFITLGAADFALGSLWTNHGAEARAGLADTPLHEFVRSHVEGVGNKARYRAHLSATYGYDALQIDRQVTRFETLIDRYRDQAVTLHAVVRLSSIAQAELVDGAHRATIVQALGRESTIRCWVIDRIVTPSGAG